MEYTLSLPMPPPAGAEPSGRTAVIVLGGDARQVAVIRALTGAGCAVYAAGLCGAAGLPEGVRLCGTRISSFVSRLTLLSGGRCPLPGRRLPVATRTEYAKSDESVTFLGACPRGCRLDGR